MAASRSTFSQASAVSRLSSHLAIIQTFFARCTVVAWRAVPWSALPLWATSFMSNGQRVTSKPLITLYFRPRSNGSLNDGCRSQMRAMDTRPCSSAKSLFRDRTPLWMMRSVAVVWLHLTVAISRSFLSSILGSKPPDPCARRSLKARIPVGSPSGIR